MPELSEIPDDMPEEYLSGAALALRADNPDEIISSLEKGEALTLIRYLLDTPDDAVGETNVNVTTKELRHIARKAMEAYGQGGEEAED